MCYMISRRLLCIVSVVKWVRVKTGNVLLILFPVHHLVEDFATFNQHVCVQLLVESQP